MRSPVFGVLAAAVFALAASCSQQKPAEDQPSANPADGVETPANGPEAPAQPPTVLPTDDQSGTGMTLEEKRAEALAKIDVTACQAAGGKVQQEGLLGMPRCVTPYKDAGKSCRDGDDCDGKCIGDDAVTEYNAPPGELVGVCQANDSPFGCFAEIEDGSTTGMICVD